MRSLLVTCLLLVIATGTGDNNSEAGSINTISNSFHIGNTVSAEIEALAKKSAAGSRASAKKRKIENPVRIAVAGLSHDHVHWIFRRDDIGDIEIVGIFEPNETLWQRYRDQYGLNPELYYENLDEMLDSVNPKAVTGFGSIYAHLDLVEAAAPRGIHIMVEKPLAVNMDHALRMQELVEIHGVHLITNYETTWYASNHTVYDKFRNSETFGKIRKMVIHDGHRGPKEIGVSEEFLDWLTDPVLNGGGAIIDFGCYGANLSTWLMNGEEPVSVTAFTRTYKPHIYDAVDDDATIIINYPDSQAIIQASWNWPYNRKDMHVYGETGYMYAVDSRTIRILEHQRSPVETHELEPRSYPYDDPFSYFSAVVRGEIDVEENDLSSLENNMTVVKILDAARESAKTGRTVFLREQ